MNPLFYTLRMPFALVVDVYHIGRAIVQLLSPFCKTVHRQLTGPPSPRTRGLDQESITLDLRCISWMLQTSLDKAVHLSTLKHLGVMMMLTDFNPTLVMDCFNAVVSCVKVNVNDCEAVVAQWLEELATVSTLCFFGTVSHLLSMDPASTVFKDIRQRYIKVFPARVGFHSYMFYHTMNAVYCLFIQGQEHRFFQRDDYKPSAHEHTMVSNGLVKLARFEYQAVRLPKVPRWILQFTLHSLSLDPLPPMSVVADCLSIIALDLGCNAPNTGTMGSDESYIYAQNVNISLTQSQRASGTSLEPDNPGIEIEG